MDLCFLHEHLLIHATERWCLDLWITLQSPIHLCPVFYPECVFVNKSYCKCTSSFINDFKLTNCKQWYHMMQVLYRFGRFQTISGLIYYLIFFKFVPEMKLCCSSTECKKRTAQQVHCNGCLSTTKTYIICGYYVFKLCNGQWNQICTLALISQPSSPGQYARWIPNSPQTSQLHC